MLMSNSTKSANVKDKQVPKSHRTMATIVSDNKGNSSATNPCLFCAGHHNLCDCKNITLNLLKDRYTFLKTKGLCFSCLKTGHRKHECKGKLTCNICKRLHPTILHVQPRMEVVNSNEANATLAA